MRIFILSPQTIVCVDILVPEPFSLLPNSRKTPLTFPLLKLLKFAAVVVGGWGVGVGTGGQKNISFRYLANFTSVAQTILFRSQSSHVWLKYEKFQNTLRLINAVSKRISIAHVVIYEQAVFLLTQLINSVSNLQVISCLFDIAISKLKKYQQNLIYLVQPDIDLDFKFLNNY